MIEKLRQLWRAMFGRVDEIEVRRKLTYIARDGFVEIHIQSENGDWYELPTWRDGVRLKDRIRISRRLML